MNIFTRTTMVAAAATLLALQAPAQAAPITIGFSGTVSSVFGDDSSGTFAATFTVGQAVNGTFTFDSLAVGTPFVGLNLTEYAATFEASVGAKKFFGPIDYRIFDNAGAAQDGFNVVAENGNYSIDPTTPVGSMVPSTFFLQFLGMPNATLASQALVLDPAALVPLYDPFYAPHGFRLDNKDGTYGAAYFNISVVPEPGNLALLVAGLGLVGMVVRRRRAADL